MMRGSTPTFTVTLDKDVDLSLAKAVQITFQQDRIILTKTGDSLVIDGNQLQVYLSQSETLKFRPGCLHVQMNWVYPNNSRACTEVVCIDVCDNLLNEVV